MLKKLELALIIPEIFDKRDATLDILGEHTPVFRPYISGEEPQIKKLVLDVLGEIGFTYDPILNADIDDLASTYGVGLGRMLVVVHKGKIIGTHGLVDKLDGTAYCRRLTLAKTYRGNGWLYPEMAYVCDYCKRCGFQVVRFDTLERSGMIPSYEKFGFSAIKREPEGSDIKVIMELVL